MIVINLLAEPGAGKSVTAAGLYYQLSINNYKAEVIPEVAKGYAWESVCDKNGDLIDNPIFKQQILLFGEQNRVLQRVYGKRDICIMECPLIMGIIYKDEPYFPSFEGLVLEQFREYNNFNIVLERSHSFDNIGRVHNENQSSLVKNKLLNYLEHNQIPYIKFKTHKKINEEIFNYLMEHKII